MFQLIFDTFFYTLTSFLWRFVVPFFVTSEVFGAPRGHECHHPNVQSAPWRGPNLTGWKQAATSLSSPSLRLEMWRFIKIRNLDSYWIYWLYWYIILLYIVVYSMIGMIKMITALAGKPSRRSYLHLTTKIQQISLLSANLGSCEFFLSQ